MALIKGYPSGSDITIVNTSYQYPKKQEDGKYSNDYLTIVFRDNTTGKKDHTVIERPDYEFFMANDDVLINHHLQTIEMDKVHKVVAPYCELEKTIAELTGNEEFYWNNIRVGNRSANKELHYLMNVFASKFNIEDHYRFLFAENYTNSIFSIKKGYFDIEVDSIDMMGDFPEMGECPINAISFINDSDHSINIFLLRNDKNPLIAEFEKEVASGSIYKELQDFIINHVGLKLATQYGMLDFKINFSFYDEEIRLIQDFFLLVNKHEPDFLIAWNMAFDIPYIHNRLRALGYDPRDIMCHRNFEKEFRRAEYYIDTRAAEFAERGDFYDISSYTVYLDQLIHFASRRKGQKAFDSYKLDDIGSEVAKIHKLDYSHITTSISKLPYLNYKVFVFYNVMDTIVQKGIEEKVKDLNYIFGKCIVNNTRYEKCHRQTVYLSNRANAEWRKDGLIIGNGSGTKEKVSYPGALVGDPLHNSDYSKYRQDNQVMNIVDNMCDFDYKALYPSTAIQNNMGPNTQIGKIIIDEQTFKGENPFDNKFYDRGGQFLEDYTSGDLLEFAHRWLGFASYKELIDDVIEYFTMHSTTYPFYVNGLYRGVSYNEVNGVSYDDELIRGVHYSPEQLPFEQYFDKRRLGIL